MSLFRLAPRRPFAHQLSGHHGHTELHWGVYCTRCETWGHVNADQLQGRKPIHCFGCGQEAAERLMTTQQVDVAVDDRDFTTRGKRRLA